MGEYSKTELLLLNFIDVYHQQNFDDKDYTDKLKQISHQFFMSRETDDLSMEQNVKKCRVMLLIESIKFKRYSKSIKRHRKVQIFDAFCVILIVLKMMNVKKDIKKGAD